MRREPTHRATVQDVAREAGVSASTVSRALNGTGYAGAEVRERVRAAVERIGYVPDANARSLRHRTSRAIGVLVSDLRNPFYANLAAGMEEQLRAAGMHMVLTNDNADAAEELEAARTLVAMRVPGALITPVSPKAVALLRQHGVSVVQVDRRMGPGGDAVLSANETAAAELTDYLIGLGHRHIALLIDETRWSTGAGRLTGYRQAHTDRGLTVDDALVAYTSFEADTARRATGTLLDEHPEVTAVFAANNVLAQGAFEEISRRGIRMPDELSLAAYDDVPWMSMVQPGITTVSQHTQEMGRRAAQLLLDRLAETATGRARVVRVATSLRVRGSTGAVPR
ncbi:MAG: LacI family DNA-binding transcriptional regulator [Actinocatenispora sp.]